jgi:diguanylate cyclase (GGDEF)-like protein
VSAAASTDSADGLLEAVWADRGRRVVGRERRLELAITALVLAAATALALATGASPLDAHPAVLLVVAAYALAARAEFVVGAGHVVPTQLFLVPLFALAPAGLAPLLVGAGLALSLVPGDGGRRLDRAVNLGGDALHALGPALVLVALAGGDARAAGAETIALAFAAQLAFDAAGSLLHELVVFGVRPRLHARVLAQVWSVDAALLPLGLLLAAEAPARPWVVLVPLPTVVLLGLVARERTRRIDAAVGRATALERERERLQAAIRRLGEAFAARPHLESLLDIVTHAAADALSATHAEARVLGAPEGAARVALAGPPAAAALAGAAVRAAAHALSGTAGVAGEGHHALAVPVRGEAGARVGVVAVAGERPFTAAERSLLDFLCERASVAAAHALRHERLHQQALTDELTGLANHRRLQEVLGAAVARHEAHGEDAAFLLLDLDDFKAINDEHGHVAGDRILRAVADRVGATVRAGDECARYGGEELAVLVPGADRAAAAELAERIRRAVAALELRAPDGARVTVTTSIGVAALDGDVRTASDLVAAADAALYTAKGSGKNRVAVAQGGGTRAEATLAAQLREGIAAGRLEVVFQPKVRTRTGAITAVEALVRWRHPERGLLAPGAFIDVAERAGLMRPLTQAVLDLALAQARRWRDRGLELPVAVNVSASSLTDASLLGDVAALLERHDVPPSGLALELTETTLLSDPGLAQRVLGDLRALGVTVAVDDYGTGFSSLAYLRELTVDELKLDRRFAADLEHDPATHAIVRSTIDLAHSLDLRIVAEGVETARARGVLARLGCDEVQGYLITPPLPGDAMTAWLAERAAAAA